MMNKFIKASVSLPIVISLSFGLAACSMQTTVNESSGENKNITQPAALTSEQNVENTMKTLSAYIDSSKSKEFVKNFFDKSQKIKDEEGKDRVLKELEPEINELWKEVEQFIEADLTKNPQSSLTESDFFKADLKEMGETETKAMILIALGISGFDDIGLFGTMMGMDEKGMSPLKTTTEFTLGKVKKLENGDVETSGSYLLVLDEEGRIAAAPRGMDAKFVDNGKKMSFSEKSSIANEESAEKKHYKDIGDAYTNTVGKSESDIKKLKNDKITFNKEKKTVDYVVDGKTYSFSLASNRVDF